MPPPARSNRCTRCLRVNRKIERIDLHELVEDAWGSLPQDGDVPPLRLVNEVPRGEPILSDRHALLTILRNLLRNAAEHAGRATCVVRRMAWSDDRR